MTARTTTEPLARRIQNALTAMGLTSTIDTEGRGKSKSYIVKCDRATAKQMEKAQDAATAADEHTAAQPAAPVATVPNVVAPAAAAAPVVEAAVAVAESAATGDLAQLKEDLTTMAAECIRAGQNTAARHIETAIKALGAPTTEMDVQALLKMHADAGGSIMFGKVNKFRANWIAARDAGLVVYSWPDRSKGAPAAMSVLTDAGWAKVGGRPARSAGRRATDQPVVIEQTPVVKPAAAATAPTTPVAIRVPRGRRSA